MATASVIRALTSSGHGLPAPTLRTITPVASAFIYAWGGNAAMTGTVTVAGVPAARQVLLINAAALVVVRSGWSKPDGSISFAGVAPGKYYTLGLDYTGAHDPEAKVVWAT